MQRKKNFSSHVRGRAAGLRLLMLRNIGRAHVYALAARALLLVVASTRLPLCCYGNLPAALLLPLLLAQCCMHCCVGDHALMRVLGQRQCWICDAHWLGALSGSMRLRTQPRVCSTLLRCCWRCLLPVSY